MWDTLYGNDIGKRVRYKFQVGDRVRISKAKRMFEKSYLPNFTEEMFTIYKRFARQVPVYKLKDDAGEIIDGTFYEAELQKVIKKDDVYRVEKALRKRKRKGVVEYLVKWKGYPSLRTGSHRGRKKIRRAKWESECRDSASEMSVTQGSL